MDNVNATVLENGSESTDAQQDQLAREQNDVTTGKIQRNVILQRPLKAPTQQMRFREFYGSHGSLWRDRGLIQHHADQNEFGRQILLLFGTTLFVMMSFVGVGSYLGMMSRSSFYPITASDHLKMIVSNVNGAIRVHGQQNGPFGVQERRYAAGFGLGLNDMGVAYRQTGATFDIDARVDSNPVFIGSRHIDLDITIPSTTDVTLYTETGVMTIDNLHGNVSAQVGKGSVSVSDSKGNFSLATDNGPIHVQNVQGAVTAVANVGSVDLHQTSLSGHSSVEAMLGTVMFQGLVERRGSYLFSTYEGPVNLTLPTTLPFHVYVTDGSGIVRNDFKHLTNGKGEQAPITVRTHKDEIDIHKQVGADK
ncbi:MAG TPA: hypothetical protein VL461_06140 [Dictyobacter sp.]|jgi:hypothetical protein|nr:hypothetical protein [Dictyobacter sp.]